MQIPPTLAALYGRTQSDMRFIAQVQNYIFGYNRGDQEFILRLTPDLHRDSEQVMAEIEWVDYLVARGVPAAAPVPAVDGSLCQRVQIDGINYTAVAFEKVGGDIGNRRYWTPAVFKEWGCVTGRMHRESVSYWPNGIRLPQAFLG